jgi:hypothetical protein
MTLQGLKNPRILIPSTHILYTHSTWKWHASTVAYIQQVHTPEELPCLVQAVHAEQVEHQAVAGGELGLQRLRTTRDDGVSGLSTLKPENTAGMLCATHMS